MEKKQNTILSSFTPPPSTPVELNEIEYMGRGSQGCIYKHLPKSTETTVYNDELANKFIKNLKCVTTKESDKYELEKSHLENIAKIHTIDLTDYANETESIANETESIANERESIANADIVKETLTGEVIQTIPDYYLYFAPLLSSCPFNIDRLPLQEKMKCKLLDNMDDEHINLDLFNNMLDEKDSAQQLYINSTVQFVKGKNMQTYFRELLMGEGELSTFFITRFIHSYRHLLKALRLLQKGPESNKIIIHRDLNDRNVIYDTKRGLPIIIDFGLSFAKSGMEDNLHPKKLLNIFFEYYSKYPPWVIDIVVISYIINVVLLKKGDNEELMKEIYEKEIINVENLKKVCDDYMENNEILRWIDTLQNPHNADDLKNTENMEDANVTHPSNNTDVNKVSNIKTVGGVGGDDGVGRDDGVGGNDTNNNSTITPTFDLSDPFNQKKLNTPSTETISNETINGVSSIRNKMKNQWYTYIDSFAGKVWKEIAIDLIQRYPLWDVYSISICYLEYIYRLELLSGKYKIPTFFMDFVEELKSVFYKE